MPPRPTRRRDRRAPTLPVLVPVLAVLVAVLAACQPPLPPLPDGPVPVETTTTTAPPNRAPELGAPAELRGAVGAPTVVAVTGTDPDGDPVAVTISAAGVPGLSFTPGPGGGALRWQPTEAGTWTVGVAADDGRGGRTERTLTLLGRYPANPGAIVAMGDSVASGHGLQLRDYLGGDSCWRAESDAYPARLLRLLVEQGRWPRDGRVALVACSGVRTSDLLTRAVRGGLPGSAPAGTSSLPQVDWAVRGNPGLVTLTVGANDLGFSKPWELVRDGRLDVATLDARLARLRTDLRVVLDRLVAATDATVVVTTYYDPSATSPQGIDGCRTTCFSSVVTTALDRFNGAIGDVVAAVAAGPGGQRVRLADIRPAFVGHGAPNGLGPDGLREGGFGLFGTLVGPLTEGTHPYCARGSTTGEPWVNSVDCVHPDARGAGEIARVVAGVLP
jgi:lysophospholipase L1-like esterase